MNSTYLEKRLKAIRMSSKKAIPKTIEDSTVIINNPQSKVIDELVIYGSTRYKRNDQSSFPENPDPSPANPYTILDRNENIKLYNITYKNEITPELLNSLRDQTTWSVNPDVAYRTSTSLMLKANTYYTFSRAVANIYNQSYYPKIDVTEQYGGLAYDSTSLDPQFLNKWIWHPTAGKIKYAKFKCADMSSFVHTKYNILFNPYSYGGLGVHITEGSISEVELKSNYVEIPNQITLDNGTVVNLDLRSTPNDSGTPVIFDTIEVSNGKVEYIRRTNKWNISNFDSVTSCFIYLVVYYRNFELIRFSPSRPAKTNNTTDKYIPICNLCSGISGAHTKTYQTHFGVPGDYVGYIKMSFPLEYMREKDKNNQWVFKSDYINLTEKQKIQKCLTDYFPDLEIVYPLQNPVTTDITNSDLGRALLNFKLSKYNTIYTDNYLCNKLKITYKS